MGASNKILMPKTTPELLINATNMVEALHACRKMQGEWNLFPWRSPFARCSRHNGVISYPPYDTVVHM